MTSPWGKFLPSITVPTGGWNYVWSDPAATPEYEFDGDYAATYAGFVAALSTGFGALPDFGWKAGDGNAPSHWGGAANTSTILAATNTPAAGYTPWQTSGGAAIASETYDGTAYRATAAVNDPSDGDDIVAWWLGRVGYAPGGGADVLVATCGAASGGWQFYRDNANNLYYFCQNGAAAIGQATYANLDYGTLVLIVGVAEYGGNVTAYVNGTAGGTAQAMPTDVIGGANGIALAAQTNGNYPAVATTGCVHCGCYYGTGLAEVVTAGFLASLQRLASGFANEIGATAPVFARASCASALDRNNRLWVYHDGMPRCGDSEGLRIAPTRENLCYRNINPQATTGWSTTGGTLTAESDASALATAKLENLGPNVFKFVPGAGDEVVYGGDDTGCAAEATQPFAISVWMRGASGGESVNIGVRDDEGNFDTWTTAVLTTSYVRYSDPITLSNDADQFALEVAAGDTVYFIGSQLELGPNCTSLMPNWATGASATRAAETMDLGWTPSDDEGHIECNFTPVDWGYLDIECLILDRVTGNGDLLRSDATYYLATDDGTTEVLDSSTAIVDGVEMAVVVSWGDALTIEVEGNETSDSYDGALQGSGLLRIEADQAEIAVDTVVCYDVEGGAVSVATVAAGTYATIIELLDELADKIDAEITPSTCTVTVSATGIITITIPDATASWGTCSSDLLAILGLAGTESYSSGTVIATSTHRYGWYPGVISFGTTSGEGISDDTGWVPQETEIRTVAGNGNARIIRPARDVHHRSLRFDLIGRTERTDPYRGVAMLERYAVDRQIRWFMDRDQGADGDAYVEGDPHDSPLDSSCDAWIVTLVERPRVEGSGKHPDWFTVTVTMNGEPD